MFAKPDAASPDLRQAVGQRFVVRAEEKLTAFLELELAMRAYGELI